MKSLVYKIDGSHTLKIEKIKRGLEDDYCATFFENGRALGSPDYYSEETLYIEFGVNPDELRELEEYENE